MYLIELKVGKGNKKSWRGERKSGKGRRKKRTRESGGRQKEEERGILKRDSEGLEAQEATSPSHRWHLSLLLWTAPPSRASQSCTRLRRRSGESTRREKRRETWVRKLKGQHISLPPPPHHHFHLPRSIISSNS